MRKLVLLFAAFAFAVLMAPAGTSAGAAPAEARGYIITLEDGASPAAVAAEHGSRHGAQVRHVYKHALRGYAAHMTPAKAAEVAADPRVRSVAPERTLSIAAPTKPPSANQTLPTGIDRIDGEKSSTVSGNGSGAVNVDVAVIDTGVDLDHPDLNVVGGVNCITGSQGDDGNGHGSHVAGTIGARDNGFGVVGVAPGARIWSVKVLSNGGVGSDADVICGIDWVTARAGTIEVANMSLGGPGAEPSQTGCNTADPFHDAICRSVAAGVTYAVAAGNESDDAAFHTPAAYDEVITVSALTDYDGKPGGLAAPTCTKSGDVDDTFSDFSNFGLDVDLIAPGRCILSTWKGGGYNTISGTSMATPHVAGAAALYKSTHAGATPAQVRTALRNAGTLNWNAVDDPDDVKERLLNVDPF